MQDSNPDEWLCKCQAANPITRGECWLCGKSGQVERYLYWPTVSRPNGPR